MRISLVPPDMVVALYPKVFRHLQRAADYTFGRYEPEDIVELASSGGAEMWVAIDEAEDVKGISVTRAIEYPRKKCLEVIFISGEDLCEWRAPMLEVLQHWAHDSGCACIESSGRPGFSRVFKDDGYRLLWQVFELPAAEKGLGDNHG